RSPSQNHKGESQNLDHQTRPETYLEAGHFSVEIPGQVSEEINNHAICMLFVHREDFRSGLAFERLYVLALRRPVLQLVQIGLQVGSTILVDRPVARQRGEQVGPSPD